MKKQNQFGFSTLESLLIFVLIIILGFTGWFVWHKRTVQNATSSVPITSVKNKTYTDSAKVYTLQYPIDWILTYGQAPSEGPTPDWTSVSRSINLVAPNAPKGATGVTVRVWERSYASNQVAVAKANPLHVVKDTKINGYDSVQDTLNFTGPSAAEKYVDHNYFIYTDRDVIYLSFRESWYHPMSSTDWNDSKHLADFQNIVQSVRLIQ